MDLGCDVEQGVTVCKFVVSTPGSSIPGAAFAASENAPVERIRILSGKATDNVNFTLVMGAVMAITEADMSRDERGELALDLIKRFIRGSENPEVSGKLGMYRLDSVDGGGTMLEAQRGQ